MNVQDQSLQVAALAVHWTIVDALLGGTPAMRAAGEKFLPKFPNEDADTYKARLGASTLLPAFRRTLSVMAGKPFSKALTFGEDSPERIVELCEDVDLQGNSLHVFASGVFREALSHGFCGVLIDYPVASGIRTLADERSMGARPYFVHVRHNQILGWRVRSVNGRAEFSQLRLAETTEAEDGEFGTKTINRVRVLEPGRWRLYEQQEGSGLYLLIDEGMTTLARVPFVPFVGERVGKVAGVSPLLDLAHLNVKHWRSQSDQDNILHVARVPILVASGVDDTFALTVGASSAVKITNPDGRLMFVEHSGSAIAAGAAALAALEDQMIQSGAELLVNRPGNRTATESANDAEANRSDLLRMAETAEDGIDQCLQIMAGWLKLPEGGHVSLYKDFGAATLSEASAQLVLGMRGQGLITRETAIRELQRRGELSPDLDPAAEIEAADMEGPALGAM